MTVEDPHHRFVSTVSEMLGGLCVSVAFPQIMVFGKAMWQPLTGGESGVVRNRCFLCISTSNYVPAAVRNFRFAKGEEQVNSIPSGRYVVGTCKSQLRGA